MLQALCERRGPLKDGVKIRSKALPQELEWGEVLVSMQYAPVDSFDAVTCAAADASTSNNLRTPPFVAGSQGVGVVLKVLVYFHFSLNNNMLPIHGATLPSL